LPTARQFADPLKSAIAEILPSSRVKRHPSVADTSAPSGKASMGHCAASVAIISRSPLSAIVNSLRISNKPVGATQATTNIAKRILEITGLHFRRKLNLIVA
jgi:hypothetical protein